MALHIKLALEKASRGERLDRYYAQEGDWFFEVHAPCGERPTAVDVHFEFEDEEKTEP
jgi:hypothetical protein